MRNKYFILVASLLFICNISISGQIDSAASKNKIGLYTSMSTGWDHVEFKYYPIGNVVQLSYGFSFERNFSQNFSFESGLSHSIFWGGWFRTGYSLGNTSSDYTYSRELLHHIRAPLIAKYFFHNSKIENFGIIAGSLPGFILDKQSRIYRTDIMKYERHYLRYGGFDLITPIAGIEYARKAGKQISVRTQFRIFVQNEVIVSGISIGINFNIK